MAEREGFWQNLKKRLKAMAISSWLNISIAIFVLLVSIKSCSIAEHANNISEKAAARAEQANNLSDTANKSSDTANKTSLDSNRLSAEANKIAKEVFDIQNTPRLFAYIVVPSYVGVVADRTDEVVTMAIIVSNNSNAFAYNVEVDVIFADGSGRMISFNEQQKKIPAPRLFKDRLTPGEPWVIKISPSTYPNAKENYTSGKTKCKAKIQVMWKGVKGEEYKFINLEELRFSRVEDKQITEFFWFDSLNNYSSIDNSKDVDKNWGLSFNY